MAANQVDDEDEVDAAGPSGPAMPAQPSASPSPVDINQYKVTDQELADNRARKNRNSGLAMMADALANQQSFGNFFLGKMNPQRDVGQLFRQDSANADQAIADKKALMAQALQEPERQRVMAALDKNSPDSQAAAQQYAAAVDMLAKQKVIGQDTADLMKSQAKDMNMAQIGRLAASPLMKDAYQMAGEQMKADTMGKRLAMMQSNQDRNYGMKQDNQAVAAASQFDKDPLLQTNQRQINQLGIDKHTLTGVKIITPQMLHEVGAGVASVLNQGKAAGLGQMELQDPSTSLTKLAQLEQMLLNKPENGASPEIKAQIIETIDRLNDGLQKVSAARAQMLTKGKNYAHNPAAQAAMEEKAKSYSGDSSMGGMPNAVADDGAKPPHGNKVIQNGHEYIWNPQTKSYE